MQLVSNFSKLFSFAATVFSQELIMHKYSVESYCENPVVAADQADDETNP